MATRGRLERKDMFLASVGEDRRIGNDLLLMGKEYWSSGSEPFITESTTVLFLTKGKAGITVNMTDYIVNAPSMILLMEGMMVSLGEIDEDARLDVIFLSKDFTDDMLSESNVYGQVRARIQSSPIIPLAGQAKVTFAFNYLLMNLVAMKDSPHRRDSAKHMALTLFYGFALSQPSPETRNLSTRADVLTDKFLDLVKSNYKEHRSVAFYADALCITPKYLSLSVKESTGKPALEWIDDYVCAEAKAMLRSTDMTIDKIGESLGFMNLALFGKYFKRVTGLSPRKYRYSNR